MRKTMKRPLPKGRANVPLIMQMEELECGAACLAMVMAYYGKWLPLEQVRADCGVSRDGANAKKYDAGCPQLRLYCRGISLRPPYSAKQRGISLYHPMEFQPLRGA